MFSWLNCFVAIEVVALGCLNHSKSFEKLNDRKLFSFLYSTLQFKVVKIDCSEFTYSSNWQVVPLIVVYSENWLFVLDSLMTSTCWVKVSLLFWNGSYSASMEPFSPESFVQTMLFQPHALYFYLQTFFSKLLYLTCFVLRVIL